MRLLAGLLFQAAVLTFYCATAASQTDEPDARPSESPREFSRAELERLLAPVALYPDTLLSLVLMAATYPSEVMEAARWSKQNPRLQGEAAVRAVMRQPWDTAVRTIAAFPLLLSQMNESVDWMRRLGQAYLARESEVLEVIQGLRQKAHAAGHLRSGELAVERRGANLIIESSSGSSVSVPSYSPAAVYGSSWLPQHPPVEWAPWPGYAKRGGAIAWGPAVPMSRGFVYAGFDWTGRHAHIANIRNYTPVAAYSSMPRPAEPANEEKPAPNPEPAQAKSEKSEPKPAEPAAAQKPQLAAPAAPPVPLVNLFPQPVPRAEQKSVPVTAARDPAPTNPRPAPLVDLARPAPTFMAKAAPAAIEAKSQDAGNDAGASLLRLLPGALEPTPGATVPEAKMAPEVKPAPMEPPRQELAMIPKREEMAPARIEERVKSAVVEPSASAGASAPAAVPPKPRPRAFASDADRRTLDLLVPAPSGRSPR